MERMSSPIFIDESIVLPFKRKRTSLNIVQFIIAESNQQCTYFAFRVFLFKDMPIVSHVKMDFSKYIFVSKNFAGFLIP
jgi:hypothetical protein